MVVRWKIPFKSIGGTDYMVNIYDSTFSGEATTLTGTSNPFVTTETSSDDIMAPVRISTGEINIVNTGNLDGILPTTPKARYVTLVTGGNIVWQGYIKQEQYTQPWDRTPYAITLPIISCMGILEGRQMEKGDVADRARFAEYMRLAIVESGGTYDNIVFPSEYGVTGSGVWDMFFKLGTQDRNWFEYKNQNVLDPDESRYDGMTWLEVLSAWMTAFGYTMYENGKTIYIVHRIRKYYLSVAVSALSTLAANSTPTETSIEASTVNIGDMQIGGSNGTVDILPTKRRAIVEGEINPFQEDSTPMFDTKYLTFMGMLTIQKAYSDQQSYGYYYYNKTMGVYEPEQGQQYWTFRSYNNGTLQQYSAQDITRDYHIAVFARDKSGEDYILINYNDVNGASGWGGTSWMCSLKSQTESFFAAGYISIHAKVVFNEGEGGTAPGTHRAKFMLRIGNYYYNGDTHQWQTTEAQFLANIDDNGEIVAYSNVEQGDNGCIYLEVPSSGIYGDVELYIYTPYSVAQTQQYHQAVYEISKLDISYAEPEIDVFQDYPEGSSNRFVVSLDKFASEDESKSLALTSFINEHMGYGVLLKPDFSEPLGKIYNRFSGTSYFEEILVNTIASVFGKTQQILTIPLRHQSTLSPINLYSCNGTYRYLNVRRDWRDDLQTLKIFKTNT